MGLNKQKGNMYPFVTHTYNVIKGKCPHDCSYCYMKIFRQPELHFDEAELKTDLGQGNFIFVGSSCDMWAKHISIFWIAEIIAQCKKYDNKYLFQSKNPLRFFQTELPPKSLVGTTIESNRDYLISKAPNSFERYKAIKGLPDKKMVSIEPIMDFDPDEMVRWIKEIAPEFVSIGADSKGHKLPEPPPDKIKQLIWELQSITTVKVKSNLKRLLRQELPS